MLSCSLKLISPSSLYLFPSSPAVVRHPTLEGECVADVLLFCRPLHQEVKFWTSAPLPAGKEDRCWTSSLMGSALPPTCGVDMRSPSPWVASIGRLLWGENGTGYFRSWKQCHQRGCDQINALPFSSMRHMSRGCEPSALSSEHCQGWPCSDLSPETASIHSSAWPALSFRKTLPLRKYYPMWDFILIFTISLRIMTIIAFLVHKKLKFRLWKRSGPGYPPGGWQYWDPGFQQVLFCSYLQGRQPSCSDWEYTPLSFLHLSCRYPEIFNLCKGKQMWRERRNGEARL